MKPTDMYSGSAQKGVLMVGNFLSAIVGTRSTCEELAPRLADAGWNVITTSTQGRRTARLLDMMYTTWRHRHQYSVAHVDVYSGPAFIWAEAVCSVLNRLRKPYVLTLHGGNLPRFARSQAKRVKRLLSGAAVITTPSGYLRDHLQPYTEQAKIVPNAINVSRYQFRRRTTLRPRLIWLRALHEIYNPQMAIDVVSRIKMVHDDVHLNFVGPDKGCGKQLTESVKARKLNGNVSFSGRVTKQAVADMMQTGDIFLNTANVDNTPVSVIEAMACGLCVITTDAGGLPWLITHDSSGIVVPRNATDAMASAVIDLLRQPDRAKTISEGARAVAEDMDWARVIPQWESIFTEVASRHG